MRFIKAGVIGYPVGHSKSPLIHNHWINRYGLSGLYSAVEIRPERLQEGVEELITQDYAGFNVTIPHKETIFKLCKQVDGSARVIGAVNTVVLRDGELFGTNTDAFGFIENIRQTVPAFDFTQGPAVVVGAGGAARAVVHGLIEAGVPSVTVTNRTEQKAMDVTAMNPGLIKTAPWEKRSDILSGARLLVNTTALGMTGKDPLFLDLERLPREALVCDIVYVPLMTDLLVAAKNRRNPVVTGIGMLLHQARPAFERWFGVLPDVDDDLIKKVLP